LEGIQSHHEFRKGTGSKGIRHLSGRKKIVKEPTWRGGCIVEKDNINENTLLCSAFGREKKNY
jgi:hypothetical protein